MNSEFVFCNSANWMFSFSANYFENVGFLVMIWLKVSFLKIFIYLCYQLIKTRKVLFCIKLTVQIDHSVSFWWQVQALVDLLRRNFRQFFQLLSVVLHELAISLFVYGVIVLVGFYWFLLSDGYLLLKILIWVKIICLKTTWRVHSPLVVFFN